MITVLLTPLDPIMIAYRSEVSIFQFLSELLILHTLLHREIGTPK